MARRRRPSAAPSDTLPPSDVAGKPIDWDVTKPHPFHGPIDELPRAADGSIPRYYYLSPEEIVRIGILPPHLEPERRREGAGLRDEQKAQFLDALAAAGTVSGACRIAGLTRMAAYRERNRPDAVVFREAWDMAVRATVRILTDSVLERAIEGVEEPVFHKGQPCGTRRRYNERLTIFLLRTLDPETFGQARDRPVAIPARTPGLPPALAAVSGPPPARALDVALDRVEGREEGAGDPQITRARVTSVTDTPAPAAALSRVGDGDCPPPPPPLDPPPSGDRAAAASQRGGGEESPGSTECAVPGNARRPPFAGVRDSATERTPPNPSG